MSGEQWKMAADGWSDTKQNPIEPDEWYERRWVDDDGEVAHGWFVSWFGRQQWRRLPDDRIVANEKAKKERTANADYAFASLPAFSLKRACPKCGATDAKARWQESSDKFGENGVLHRTCRCCRYIWQEKPLTDLEFRA